MNIEYYLNIYRYIFNSYKKKKNKVKEKKVEISKFLLVGLLLENHLIKCHRILICTKTLVMKVEQLPYKIKLDIEYTFNDLTLEW